MPELLNFYFQLLTILIVNRYIVKFCSRMKTQRIVNCVKIYYSYIRNIVILAIHFSSFFKEKSNSEEIG